MGLSAEQLFAGAAPNAPVPAAPPAPAAPKALSADELFTAPAKAPSAGLQIPEPVRKSLHVLKGLGGEAAAGADFFADIFAQALQTGAYASARGIGIAAGEPAAQGAKEASAIADKVGSVLMDPFEKILGVMGAGDVSKGTAVKAGESKISELIDKAATKAQDLTGGRIRKEDVEANFGALMTGLGFKGGDALEAKIADAARRRAQGKSAPREPGGEPTEDEVNRAYADWNAGLGEEEPAGGAEGGAEAAEPQGSTYETQPPAPPSGPSMGDYLRAKKKPGFERTAEDLMTIRRFEQTGAIDPELLKRLGLVTGGAVLGTLVDPNHPEGGMLGAGLGLLGGMMRGRGEDVPSAFRQSGAVKGPGGVWDPSVPNSLSWKLFSHLQVPEEAQERVLQAKDWAQKAVTRYLNKYAATDKDPLKDVELPSGQKWGQAWDAITKSREEPGPRGPEKVWDFRTQGLEEGGAHDSIRDYLGHVGDYMSQSVPWAKWGQYDLTRAVKETAAHDEKMQKLAEKANIDAGADLPVYKDYPDTGFKWVQIKGPARLTEEQRRGVVESVIRRRDAPDEAEYIAVDHTGKPVTNEYTGREATGASPEEAWTAGQLAREGNQMGHCVGGYCRDVMRGSSRIYSLRDAKGRSHVTIEVDPPSIPELLRELTPEEDARLHDLLLDRGFRLDAHGHWVSRQGTFLRRGLLKLMLKKIAPEVYDRTVGAIEQIKGKGNRKPNPEYIPYVQDFVKGADWKDVGDIANAELHPIMKNGGSMYPQSWHNVMGEEPSPHAHLLNINPADLGLEPGYYTEPELREAAQRAHDAGAGFGGPRSEKGQIDRTLLTGLASAGLGAAAAAYVDPQSPITAAILGGVAGLWMSDGVHSLFKHSPEEAQQARNISNNLYALTKRGQERQLGLIRYLKGNVPQDYKGHAAEIYRSYEHPEMKLSPRAQELKDNLVEPVRKGNARIRAALKALGVDVGPELEDYVHRIAKGQGPSVFEVMAQTSAQGMRKGLSRLAPSLKQRTAFALEDGEGGRMVVTDSGSGKLTIWKDGKAVGHARRIGSKPVKYKGREWRRVEAPTDEIEQATKLRYYHDALGTAVDENVRLGRALENAMFIEGLKTLPGFSDIALPAADAPHDWQQVSIPQLQQYRFSPQVAETLQDFSGELKDTPAAGLAHLSRVMIGSLFWNPLPHIFNIMDHAFVNRGATALVNPIAYVRGVRTAFQAWREVSEQGPLYLRMLHNGAGLMYPNVVLRNFGEQVMRQLGHTPEGSALSTALGYANPLEMVRRVYGFSRKNLWFWNDVIMMQAYLEKAEIRGKSPEDVMRSVEAHIPNYRVPERVAGTRLISHLLQSPFVTAFGRYDYGRLRSYGEMVKDVVGKNVPARDRLHAMDQMAALGIAGLIVYPMILDRTAQALTGNPRASVQRFGANTIPYLLYEYMSGAKDLNQIVESAFPQSPIPELFEEALNNRDLFTGRRLFVTPQDVTNWIAKQFNPLYIVGQVQSGKASPEQFFWRSLGIKSPTAEQELHKQEYREREAAMARNRRRKESQ